VKKIAAVGFALACLWLVFPVAAQQLPKAVPKVTPGYGPDHDQSGAQFPQDPNNYGKERGVPPAVLAELKKAPTPRTADGHPDLSGFWGTAGNGYAVAYGYFSKDGKTYYTDAGGVYPPGGDLTPEQVADRKRRLLPENLPPYKPELIAKVQDHLEHHTQDDPVFHCGAPGFPRIGSPTNILQTPTELVFLYDKGERNAFRFIPTDGRGHDPTLNPSYYGDSIGHWEGDTMVIDVVNLDDSTTLSGNAPFHSDVTHVVEKLRREGNVLNWEVTVDDPKVFTKPYTQHQTVIIGLKGGHALEEAPCAEHDTGHLVNSD